MLSWAKQFNIFCFLDNHQYQIEPHSIECLLGAGSIIHFDANTGNQLTQLQDFITAQPGWLMGHFSYDLKNELEPLTSSHFDGIQFPDIFFFKPRVIIRLTKSDISIETEAGAESILNEILSQPYKPGRSIQNSICINQRLSKQEYIDIIHKLKKHILRGDCYEMNYCMEFFAENFLVDTIELYKKLSAISPNPFSALYRVNDKYLICASPERFLKKTGNTISSQPIKGTNKRDLNNILADQINKEHLLNSIKERSENVMVVDIVRNDLSKVCKKGTVQVDELFGIYSFPQVHQMISTISGELKENISFIDIIKATFPMGSMTGAPKKRVMELIEKYERSKRGIFSGAVGYIDPRGDFDFNVVIRSIMYNAGTNYLSYQVGSGITFNSDPEKEWEECLIKAEAIKKVLAQE